jgi:hypothetical protein
MKTTLLFTSILLISLFSTGQEVSVDTIADDKQIGKFLLNFDSRQSFVLGQRTKMNGIRLGMELLGRYRLGVGFYNMRDPIILNTTRINGTDYDISLKLNYTTFFTEYVFYKDYKFTASAVMSTGLGSGELNHKNQVSRVDSVVKTPSFPIIATNLAVYYHPISWLAVGGGVGVRRVVQGDKNFKKVFNSPIYIFKIKVILGTLFKAMFKREEILAEREKYHKERSARIAKRKNRREEK